jgi:hypothetical protein
MDFHVKSKTSQNMSDLSAQDTVERLKTTKRAKRVHMVPRLYDGIAASIPSSLDQRNQYASNISIFQVEEASVDIR